MPGHDGTACLCRPDPDHAPCALPGSRRLFRQLRPNNGGTISKLQMALDKASDKLMIGMVVGSLVIGSSLVLLASPLTLPKEISWVAIIGYTAAVLAGFYAIYHVIFLKFRMQR